MRLQTHRHVVNKKLYRRAMRHITIAQRIIGLVGVSLFENYQTFDPDARPESGGDPNLPLSDRVDDEMADETRFAASALKDIQTCLSSALNIEIALLNDDPLPEAHDWYAERLF